MQTAEQEGRLRRARSIPTLDAVEVGDHVCWLAPSEAEFDAIARAFVADAALYGDKVLILGPAGTLGAVGAPWPDLVTMEPGGDRAVRDPAAIGPLIGREARVADGQGFRALRVLARMEYLWPGSTPAVDHVAKHELGLDAVIAGGRALVVCSYRADHFTPAVLRQAGSVHPQHLGTTGPVAPNFRMFSQGPDCWSVSGIVDFEGADAFGVAVDELASRSPILRLRCDEVELIDAAGMRALATAAALPGRRVVVSGAGATVRRAWTLLGLDLACPQVEIEP